MARSPLVLALAAGLVVLLSAVNILHRWPSVHPHLWAWTSGQQPLDLPTHPHHNLDIPLDLASGHSSNDTYLLGVGKADITGPVVEINFMGYANPNQLGTGVRQRLYSRAFIVGSASAPNDRLVYLVLDTQSGDTAVRHGILQALEDLGEDYAKYYGNQNVAVTGTHSHSGPGAWLNYLLPQITSRGFHKPSYQAIVDGAVASIVQAHENLAPGKLSVGTIDLLDANINRSPYAYLANPESERKRYAYDVDKTMTVLRFSHNIGEGSKDIGLLNWFPVHGTSMLGNNTLVTGDNKGVAAWLFEKSTGDPGFVAGFSQANVGDTSPNVEGAYCEYGPDARQMCDFKTSLCGNKTQPCHGRGPYWGRDDAGTASNLEIGRRQFSAAFELFKNDSAWTPVTGDVVKSTHHFVDLSSYRLALSNGTEVKTCPAALGYSFAAGTTDGPGAFDFKQAPDDPHASPFWRAIGNRVATPNETQEACHGDKIILLDVGESSNPYEWSPNIVDVQTQRIGNLFIIVSPGEATTMAGRRWKEAVQNAAASLGEEEPTVLLGGPANTYSHYITTPEEYSIQRYEGASTLYGPWTLNVYINLTLSFLPELSSSSAPTSPATVHGPAPPIQVNDSLSFIAPVIVDRPPLFKSFGAVKSDVHATYQAGDSVSATFVGANPRNNLRLGGTFAAVEKYDEATQTWAMVRDDADYSLVFSWKRTSEMLGTSEVEIRWETAWETGAWRDGGVNGAKMHGDLMAARRESGNDVDLAGRYRLRYFGDAKSLGGRIAAFEGVSGEFKIL